MVLRSKWNWALILIGACLTLTAPAQRAALAQTGTSCTCDDVYDLINRLNMAQAARAALLEQLPTFEAADRASRKRSTLNDQNASGVTNQNTLRAAIVKGMGSVQMPGYSSSAGRTDERCRPAVASSTTTCMDEIVMWHETHVHVPACNGAPKSPIGFRAPMATVEYIKEEIAGYESEIARIKEVLRMLPESCRPSGWIGHIQYREQRTMEAQSTLPATTTRISASERTSQTMIREAKILYRESNAPTTVTAATAGPRATTKVEDTYTKYYTSTLRRSCTGGLATPRFDGTVTNTLEDETKQTGTGDKEVDVGFSYDPQNGSYSLSLEIPEAAMSATVTRKETVSGSCNGSDDGTKSTSSQFSQVYNGGRANVSGTVTPRSTADMLQGSDKVDLGPPITSPNLTITYSATVTWTFYKLP
jgi:hypothetical protein